MVNVEHMHTRPDSGEPVTNINLFAMKHMDNGAAYEYINGKMMERLKEGKSEIGEQKK